MGIGVWQRTGQLCEPYPTKLALVRPAKYNAFLRLPSSIGTPRFAVHVFLLTVICTLIFVRILYKVSTRTFP